MIQELEWIPGWVEYQALGWHHVHGIVFDAGERFTGEMIEDIAGELAEAVYLCSDARHDGHGQKHSHQEVQDAFKHGAKELLTKDSNIFAAEYQELLQKQRAYQRWGGTVPAAVLLPDSIDGREWNAIIPDKEGVPYIYKVNEKALGIGQELPVPSAENARKGAYGWEALPDKDRVERRRLERAFNKAQQRR